MDSVTSWDGTPMPNDRWHLSASSVPKVMTAKGLEIWAERRRNDAIVNDYVLLAQLIQTNPEIAKKWISDAPYATPVGQLKANERGTAMHSWLEARVLGKPVPNFSPEHLAQLYPYIVNLEAWLAEFMPEPIEVEATLLNPNDWLGGRMDLKARIRGERWILDLKTAEKEDTDAKVARPYGDSHPLQLAIYAHCTHKATWQVRMTNGPAGSGRFYLANDAELALAEVPEPIDRGGIIHLTPHHCHLHPVNIGERTYAFARNVAEAWRWLYLESKHVIGDPVQASAVEP